jgi:3D-(3,5/4)-trihydroxycyclohexane-1,2-dione acylhydrolase (decyclizing)
MALAAVGYAKAMRRRQIMVATSSIGPGALNMVTAAGVAHANRLPVLILAGDTFANRIPDPVLQQVEHFGNPTITVNDAFKAVTRYWDRITHPEQIIHSLPQAVATMLDPATCGPAFIALPQDTQELAFDYPAEFFAPARGPSRAPAPTARTAWPKAAALLKTAKRPLIISGGGVRYSGRKRQSPICRRSAAFPMVETIAGKGAVTHDHPVHAGPIGIIGSTSANALAAEADVILAIGTRLQDFTTGSWTACSRDARFISINAARFDATEAPGAGCCGRCAGNGVEELDAGLGAWKAMPPGPAPGQGPVQADWNKLLDDHQTPTNAPVPTYAQVVGVVNRDRGRERHDGRGRRRHPGEVAKGWRIKNANSL